MHNMFGREKTQMTTAPERRGWMVGALCAAMLWLGFLLGVSFLATPAKFLAPSLTLPVALDVGRHTFAVFNKVEWVLAATLLLVVPVGTRSWPGGIAAAVAALLVVAETVWLLPVLDLRLGLTIAGRLPPPSIHHDLYIAIEVAKLFALVIVAWLAAWRLARSAPRI